MNPAAERIVGLGRAHAVGSGLDRLPGSLGEAVRTLSPHTSAVVGLSGATRVKVHHGTFMDRSFPRSFFLVEELTEELRHFERAAYEKLIRVMSHEVNNTVAAANSLLPSSLAYGSADGALNRLDFEQAIGIVIARTEQLGAFMRRFADVFRLPPPHRVPINLAEVILPVVTLVAAMPEAADTTIETVMIGRSPGAAIDRTLFEQAVLNVIKNAVEAAGAGGTVSVQVSSAEGRPTIEVIENGPGLTAEAQANLFTPFFSTKAHGQGIGLTFVQEVLAAHECAYSLERSGEHTVFRIGFPRETSTTAVV